MPSPNLASWIDTIQNSIGQVLPGVTIVILNGTVGGSSAANTGTQPGSPLATIYSDPYGASPITQAYDENGVWQGITTEAGDGSFQFWAAPGYYVVQVFGPGISGQLVYGICIASGSGGGGGGTVTSYAATFTDETTLTISGAVHQLGTADISVSIYDSATGTRNLIIPNSVSVDSSTFEVTVTFLIPQSGRIVMFGAS